MKLCTKYFQNSWVEANYNSCLLRETYDGVPKVVAVGFVDENEEAPPKENPPEAAILFGSSNWPH